jgi:hypothetical protein
MTSYCYEYGKRWNSLLPRNDIRFLVSRMHCATPLEEVSKIIRQRAIQSNIPTRMLKACEQYATCVHIEQQKVYYSVVN